MLGRGADLCFQLSLLKKIKKVQSFLPADSIISTFYFVDDFLKMFDRLKKASPSSWEKHKG
jgi:hypothetical protein